jgi:hypothetical protein
MKQYTYLFLFRVATSVEDKHSFFADSDPGKNLNEDPDPRT